MVENRADVPTLGCGAPRAALKALQNPAVGVARRSHKQRKVSDLEGDCRANHPARGHTSHSAFEGVADGSTESLHVADVP